MQSEVMDERRAAAMELGRIAEEGADPLDPLELPDRLMVKVTLEHSCSSSSTGRITSRPSRLQASFAGSLFPMQKRWTGARDSRGRVKLNKDLY